MVQLAVVGPDLLHALLAQLAAQVGLDLRLAHLRLHEQVHGRRGQVAGVGQDAVDR